LNVCFETSVQVLDLALGSFVSDFDLVSGFGFGFGFGLLIFFWLWFSFSFHFGFGFASSFIFIFIPSFWFALSMLVSRYSGLCHHHAAVAAHPRPDAGARDAAGYARSGHAADTPSHWQRRV
jgi:hypothetical protein